MTLVLIFSRNTFEHFYRILFRSEKIQKCNLVTITLSALPLASKILIYSNYFYLIYQPLHFSSKKWDNNVLTLRHPTVHCTYLYPISYQIKSDLYVLNTVDYTFLTKECLLIPQHCGLYILTKESHNTVDYTFLTKECLLIPQHCGLYILTKDQDLARNQFINKVTTHI